MIFLRVMYKNHIYDPSFLKKFEEGGLEQHVDLPRLDKGKVGGAFWSAFIPCPKNGSDFSDENYSPRKLFALSSYIRTLLYFVTTFAQGLAHKASGWGIMNDSSC